MLVDATKPLQRPALLAELTALLDTFVEKRLRKATEVVTYLCKAELAKRATRDDTYQRIKRKVKRRSEIAHDRVDPENFDVGNLQYGQVKLHFPHTKEVEKHLYFGVSCASNTGAVISREGTSAY